MLWYDITCWPIDSLTSDSKLYIKVILKERLLGNIGESPVLFQAGQVTPSRWHHFASLVHPRFSICWETLSYISALNFHQPIIATSIWRSKCRRNALTAKDWFIRSLFKYCWTFPGVQVIGSLTPIQVPPWADVHALMSFEPQWFWWKLCFFFLMIMICTGCPRKNTLIKFLD